MRLWLKMMERSILQKTIFASSLITIGILLDLLLSLNAYVKDSDSFIQYEANRSIVDFFVNHSVPWGSFILLCSTSVFVFWMFKSAEYYNDNIDGRRFRKKKRMMYILESTIFEMCLFILIVRLSGGMTWYFNLVASLSLAFFRGAVYASIIVILILVFYLQYVALKQKKAHA